MPSSTLPDPLAPTSFVIDGFNVLHACLLRGTEREHWWSRAAQRRLLTWIAPFARAHDVRIWFDAKRPRAEHLAVEEWGGEEHHAESADDAIVEFVEQSHAAGQLCIVSADRSLRDRCKHRGARVLSPWEFARLVEGAPR